MATVQKPFKIPKDLEVAGTGTSTFAGGVSITGTLSIPTASPGTNTTQAASTAFVTAAVAAAGGGGGGSAMSWTTNYTMTTTNTGFLITSADGSPTQVFIEANTTLTGSFMAFIARDFPFELQADSGVTLYDSAGVAYTSGDPLTIYAGQSIILAQTSPNIWRIVSDNLIARTGDVTSTTGSKSLTISSGAVTLGKMAPLAASSIIGNNTGSSATPIALNATQVTALLNPFTSALKGLVPASGGGTVNFLRADGTWAAPPGGGTGSPGGSTGQIQYNSAGSFAGATNASIVDNCLTIMMSADVNLAPVNSFKVDITDMGGRLLPHIRGPRTTSGNTLQPHIGRNKLAVWTPPGNTNTIALFGATALTLSGTLTASNVAITNRYTFMRRTEILVTTAATTAIAGFRTPANLWALGQSTDKGGFHFVAQWGPATGVSTTTNRAFFGMSGIAAATAPTDVEPSTLINSFGMGWDAADTNIQFMRNGSTGTATKVDCGATLPVPTADRTKVYELMMFNPPGNTAVYWSVTDLVTFAQASGTITAGDSKMPATSVFLGARAYMSVGGTSSVIGLALMQLYLETDY